MNRPARLLLPLLLLGTLAETAGAQQVLRYRVGEGETFTYTLKVKLELKSPGMRMELEGTTVYVFTARNGSAPFEIEGKIHRERFDLEMKIPMIGKISGKVDTAGEKPDPPENPMDFKRGIVYGLYVKHASRVGKSFTLIVGEQGEIIKIRGLNGLLDRVREALDADPAISPLMAPSLKRDLTPENFRQGLEPMFLALPGREVKKGDAWARDFDRTMDDQSVLELREKASLGKSTEGFADFTVEVRLRKENQKIHPVSDNPMMKIRSARAKSYSEDTEGLLDLATGRVIFVASAIEYHTVLETENPLTQEVRENRSRMKMEVEVDYAPGPPKEED